MILNVYFLDIKFLRYYIHFPIVHDTFTSISDVKGSRIHRLLLNHQILDTIL